MQIFLSHSSRQKPLIREIKKGLPEHLGPWLDEEKLLFGDSIPQSIESTIKSDTDYVLLFIDEHAASSAWVSKEIEWTLHAEKLHNRTILLPIVIDEIAFSKLENVEIRNRKYLRLKDYLESSVRSLSDTITAEMFALVCRDVRRLRNPKTKSALSTIADAEALVAAQAAMIQKAVFPHRKANPIPKEKLLEVINSLGEILIPQDQFDVILSSVIQRNMIPGLVFDGMELFLLEEHARWKSEVQHEKKERIGRKASTFIRNGVKVFLDAGSTTEEVARIICKKIENRALSKLTVGTTSVKIADMISNCSVKMGFDDDFSAVRLFVPGGQIRPNTQAIIPAFGAGPRQIAVLSEAIGSFDLCIVGVNGIDVEGLTTHENSEALNKLDIMNHSSARIIVGDSSKLGLVLDCKFADIRDDLQLVIDNDPQNERLQQLVAAYPSKIVLA